MRLNSILFLAITLVISTGLTAQTRLDNPREIIGSYSLDGNAKDLSGFGNNGDVFGGSGTKDRFGNPDQALYLDGINDWIGVDYSQSLAHRGKLTLSIWAKGVSSSSGITTLIGRGNLDYDILGMDPIGIGINNGNVLQVTVAGENLVLNKFINVQIQSDRWNHYALTFSQGESVKVYLNGEIIRHFQENIPQQLRNSFNGLNIGVQSRSDILGRTFFEGSVDEVLIVKRALSEEDIYSIYSFDGWDSTDNSILSPNNENLVAYYPFNGNAIDESGNGYNAQVFNTSLVEDRNGNPNSAYYFNGVNSSALFDDSPFDFHQKFSISFWLKTSSSASDERWFHKNADSPNRGWFLSLNREEVGKFTMFLSADGENFQKITSNEIYNDDEWHFVTIVYDGLNENFSIYKDGYLDINSPAPSNINLNDNILSIFNNNFNSQYPQGTIDDIRIFNEAIDEAEVLELYFETFDQVIHTENLVAYYPFNGNAYDESTNDNIGVILGPLPTTNRYGSPNSALFFDGINDRIRFNPSESLSITGNLTISVWVNPFAFDKASSAILSMQGSTNDQDVSTNALYKLNFPSDNKLRYAHESNGGTDVAVDFTNSEFLQESWAHIALVRDLETKTLSLYKDGHLTEVHSFNDLPVGGENSALTIGENTGTTVLQDRFFYGKIDDVRIYDAALNQNEILALFYEQPEEFNSPSEVRVTNEVEENSKKVFRLHQNYPNPFNPATTIQFELNIQADVQLQVFDITGKLIQTLVNSRLTSGSHSYQFNGSNLSSGVYFYRLSTFGFTEIKKFTLIK